MAKKGGDIIYSIGFDIQKQSLNQLKKSLKDIQNLTIKDMMKINDSDFDTARANLIAIQKQAGNVQKALRDAFNVKLNTTNVESFNRSLANSGTTIEQVYQKFAKGGAVGQNAFRNLSSHVLSVNAELKQTHQTLDKFAQTFVNVAKYNLANTVFNGLTRSVEQAVGYVKSLDTSLNNIRIVTGKSADEMGRFAEQANNVAKNLGQTTVDYTNAALIYAQQGLSDKEIEARSAITLKTANVTGQSASEVSEQLTAVWNGYKVNADQAQLYVDRLAAVAATTASDLEELSKGMGKVASAAATMGVSEEQLAAQLSTIISATKQAPESVGTALRTVYARISDIQAGIDEQGVSLGNYSGKMEALGFSVLDMNGKLRDMGEVMEEIGSRWDTLTREQQIYLAQTMAGQRQYNNLLSLFDNFEEYNKALNTAQNAAGTLQEQQNIYMESTAAHLNKLKASVEDIYDSLINADSIKSIADALSSVATFTANFVDSLGGGAAILQSLGAIGVSVFSEQIAKGINTTITNFEIAKNNAREFDNALQATKEWQGIPELDKVSQDLLKNREQLLELSRMMSPEQFQGAQKLLNDVVGIGNQIQKLTEQKRFLEQFIDIATGKEKGTNLLENIVGTEEESSILSAIDKYQEKYEKFLAEIESGSQRAQAAMRIFSDGGSSDDVEHAFNSMIQSAEKFKNEIQQLESQGFEFPAFKQFIQMYEELPKVFSQDMNTDETFQKFQNFFEKLTEIATSGSKEIKSRIEGIYAEINNPKIIPKLQQTKGQQNAKNNEFNENIDRSARAIQIENYAKFASGLGQISMSIQQIQHLGSIWKNSDLSGGQKLLQTITNISFNLPMLARGIQNVNKLTNAFSFDLYNKKMDAMRRGYAILEEETAKGTAPQVIRNLDKMKKVKQEIADVQAEAAGKVQLFNGALYATPTALWTAGILAAITAIGLLTNVIEEHTRAKIEDNNTTIDDANNVQQRVESQRELITSLEELDQKQKNGEITRFQLKSSVQELIDSYHLEKDEVEALTTSYSNLTNAILEYRKAKAEEAMQAADDEKRAATENLELVARGGVWDSQFVNSDNRYQFSAGTGETRYAQETGDYKDSWNVYKAILQSGATVNGGYGSVLTISSGKDAASIAEMYELLNQAMRNLTDTSSQYYTSQEELSNSQLYSDINHWLNTMTDAYKRYTQSVQDATKYHAEFAAVSKELVGEANFSNIENVGQYLDQRQKVYDAIQKQFEERDNGDEFKENGSDITNSYLLQNYEDVYNKYGQLSKIIDQITEKTGKEFPESVKEGLQKLDDAHFENLMKSFEVSPQIFKSWQMLIAMIQQAANTNPANSEGVVATREQAEDNFAFYSSLEEQVKSGKSISKSEFKDLAPQLQQFFEVNANGTRKLTSKTEEVKKFYETLDHLKFDGFINALNELQNQIDKNQALQNGNFNYDQLDRQALLYAGPRTDVDESLLRKQVEYLNATGEIQDSVIQGWTTIIDNHQADAGLVKEIANYMEQIGDKTKDLTETGEELKESYKEVAHELYRAMFPVDKDAEQGLNSLTETVKELAPQLEELANTLEKDTYGAEEVAEGILRFDSAIQDVTKNYDDWMAALSNDALQDAGQYVDDLREAYADLLDMDGDSLSREFLTNAENLKLMKQAAEGSESAYNQLMEAAQQDIVSHLELDKTQFDADLAIVQSELDAMNFQDLEIGANLDTGNFLDALSDLVTNAHMSAEQATDYLASMGIDAEVVQQNTDAEQKSGSVQWSSTVTPQQISGPQDKVLSLNGPMPQLMPVTQAVTQWNQEVVGTPVEQTAVKENKAFSLRVTSAHKSSGGGFKFKQASHGGGSKGGSSGKGGKGKGGGGGGGKGKAAKPDTSKKDPKKPLETQKDLYHDINIELAGISRDLERVQKVQDRLYGKELIDNLNKQVAILDKQKEKLKQKQKIQEQDLKNQQKTLKNLGATFDKYGNINNYLSLIQEKQKAVNTLTARANKIIEEYNASTDAEHKKKLAADIEAYNKQIQKAQEDLKDTQSKISNYDKLREQMQDLVDDIEEITQKQIEINIKKFRTEVQIRLDMGEAERDWNDFVRNVINSDDILKDTNFDKVFEDAKQNLGDLTSYFETKQVEALANKMMQTRQQIESIDATGTSSIYGDNKAQAMQDLQNDLKDLQDQMKDISDLIQDIDEAILDTVDDIDDQLDERLEAYEFVQDLIEHDLDLMDLLYGDRNYDAMDSYYKQLQKNELDRLNLLRLQGEFWKKNYEDAIANGQTNLAKEYEKNYKDAIKNINSVIEESIKTLTDKYTNAINKIFDDLNKKITSGKGLDYLDQQWQLMTKNADQYLDAINAAFGIQQIESKFIDAINNTDTLKGQRALKKVMDQQLNNLRAKEKLTQYDVDRAEKLLQIEQARIALEAAQSSKTSLRLQRDSQGNYSYHYVADQQGISEAEDNYNQAVNDLYNFDKDKYRDNLQQMLSAWQEFQSEYKDIKTDMSLSDEERLERLALLEEQYGEYINGLAQQNTDIRVNLAGSAVNDLANLYEQDAANYEAMTLEERESLVQNLLMPWSEGIQEMIDYLNGEGGFLPVTQDSFEELIAITRDYEAELAQMAAEAGVDLDLVSQGIDQVKDEFELLGMENADLIYLMYNELNAILDLRNAAQGLVTEYQHICNAAIQAVTEIQAFIQKQQEAAASYQQTAAAYQAMIVRIQNANAALVAQPLGEYTGGYDGGGGGSSGGSGGSGGGGSSGRSGGKKSNSPSRSPVNDPGYLWKSSDGTVRTRSGAIWHGETGGYTGDWGTDEGKFAMLHEKQLVLNKEDTKNFLDGIMILRQITSNLGGSIYAKVSGLKSNYFNTNPTDEIQQKVQISASFPNVNSKRQIEEAFNDLVNLAAQRAMRR